MKLKECDNLVKHFNVMMAAVISGIVALFTSVLGVSGTIIGSVLSSFLYQLLTGYSEEKYDEGAIGKPKLANEIVHIFPLVVIGIIELIFALSSLHYGFGVIFGFLESAVSNNLFRLMGLGLIVLGAYPYFNSNNIAKKNGTVVLILGVLLLLRGLMDVTDITSKIFYLVFARYDMFFALFVVIALAAVIINILISSDNEYFKNNEFVNNHKPAKHHARKVDTSFVKRGPAVKGRGFRNQRDTNQQDSIKIDIDYQDNIQNHPQIHPQNQYQDYDQYLEQDQYSAQNQDPYHDQNQYQDKNRPPIYDEEVILVNNPEDPNNPIRKRILKKVKSAQGVDDDNYQDMYIINEQQ